MKNNIKSILILCIAQIYFTNIHASAAATPAQQAAASAPQETLASVCSQLKGGKGDKETILHALQLINTHEESFPQPQEAHQFCTDFRNWYGQIETAKSTLISSQNQKKRSQIALLNNALTQLQQSPRVKETAKLNYCVIKFNPESWYNFVAKYPNLSKSSSSYYLKMLSVHQQRLADHLEWPPNPSVDDWIKNAINKANNENS